MFQPTKGKAVKDAYNLPEEALLDLYYASIYHAAQVVLDNHDGSDDGQDYTESAIEILSLLNKAYRDDGNSDNWVVLRDTFRTLFTATDNDRVDWRFASDAIPLVWDEFLPKASRSDS